VFDRGGSTGRSGKGAFGSDGPFDIHYIDQNGKEISPEQALGPHKK
jgi:hypothetical protein